MFQYQTLWVGHPKNAQRSHDQLYEVSRLGDLVAGTMVVTEEVRTLRSEPSLEAKVVAKVEPGVYGRIEQCEEDWCRLDITGSVGWLRRFEFWGVYPKENVN